MGFVHDYLEDVEIPGLDPGMGHKLERKLKGMYYAIRGIFNF